MMRLFPSWIPISDITCNASGRFHPDDLRRAAQLILSADGLVTPLVVRQISLDRYELLDGVFEYYAAMEARKLDPARVEFINAYIIQPSQARIIAEQIALFRRNTIPEFTELSAPSIDATTKLERQFIMLRQEFKNYEERINQLVARVEGKVAPVATIAAIETRHPKTLPSEASYSGQKNTGQVEIAITQQVPKIFSSEEEAFIDFLNHADTKQLHNLGSKVPHKALDMLLVQRDLKLFDSQDGCLSRVRGKGFADGSYDRVLSTWRRKIAPAYISNLPARMPMPSSAKTKNASATSAANKKPIKSYQVNTTTSGLERENSSGIGRFNVMDAQELVLILKRLNFNQSVLDGIIAWRPFASFDTMDIPGLSDDGKQILKNIFE